MNPCKDCRLRFIKQKPEDVKFDLHKAQNPLTLYFNHYEKVYSYFNCSGHGYGLLFHVHLSYIFQSLFKSYGL